MVDANESTLDEQKYRKRFTSADSSFDDHVVDDVMILPGAVHLEMARVSGNFAYKKASVSKIKDAVWLRPVIKGRKDLDVHIRLNPDEDRVAFEVYTKAEANEIFIHSQGFLEYDFDESASPAPLDLDSIRKRCGKRSTRAECYEQFDTAGLH